MKRKILIWLAMFLGLMNFQGRAQVTEGVWRLECIEGDTLINDNACWWCTAGVPEVFYGIEVLSPSNRRTLIRHPYVAETRGEPYFVINYESDSTKFFEMLRTDTSVYKTSQEWVDYLNSCPEPPPEFCCPVIDTFELRNDSLCISLTSMDSVLCVVLPDSIPPPQYVEQFTLVDDTLCIQISEDTVNCVVIEHPPHQTIDTLEVQGDTLFVSLSEDDTTYFVILPSGGDSDTIVVESECCEDCRAALFREYFSNVDSSYVTVTVNGGNIPDDRDYLWVMREGDKLMEGGPGVGDYTVTRS